MREDIHTKYGPFAAPETVILGIDHKGKKQWFSSTREGWEEVGNSRGCLVLDKRHFEVGTKITLKEPLDA